MDRLAALLAAFCASSCSLILSDSPPATDDDDGVVVDASTIDSVAPSCREPIEGRLATVRFRGGDCGTVEVNDPVVINTTTGQVSGSELGLEVEVVGPLALVRGNTIDISASIRAVGSKPLVLAANVINISTEGSIVVSSDQASIGAGSQMVCDSVPDSGNNNTLGGAGAGFHGAGGSGGAEQTLGLGAAPLELVGGCPGAGGGLNSGDGGRGGGAVYLLATTDIVVDGTIDAGGAGGGGGMVLGVGGGGGSGGYIVLEAPELLIAGSITSHGGGGGGAGGPAGLPIMPGIDGSGEGPALGGNGSNGDENAGGNGSGTADINGQESAQASNGQSRGGGGGGAGFIVTLGPVVGAGIISPMPSVIE